MRDSEMQPKPTSWRSHMRKKAEDLEGRGAVELINFAPKHRAAFLKAVEDFGGSLEVKIFWIMPDASLISYKILADSEEEIRRFWDSLPNLEA